MLNTLEREASRVTGGMPEADRTLPQAFRQSAALHGARTALVSDTWRPTYAELDASTNRLANAFIARGGAPGDRVAILMAHDAAAVAVLVAIMKAGRIVVVLNATDPPQRLRQLLEDAEPTLIITDVDNRELAAEVALSGCSVVDFAEAHAFPLSDDPPIVISPTQVAALIYTSGSTGRPKAVMGTHRQYLRNAIIHTRMVDYTATDRLPLLGVLSGGQGMSLALSALISGAALYPFPVATRGVTGLADWITANEISAYISSASIFRNFMKTIADDFVFTGVRAVRVASESITAAEFKLFRQHFRDDCVFVHGLSCSETGSIAMARHPAGTPLPEGRVVVGRFSEGNEMLLLDENGRDVSPGEVGEICVRGRYVAAGYWRNPALTAERFSDELDDNGTRLVRTGDLGRLNAEGLLEFVGRADDRVKVRGNRIELSEIEHALQQLPGIERATVEAVVRPNREPVLIGFVVPRAQESWLAPELRRALRAKLPRHMVPSQFVILDALPFTPTGKVDRERLRRRALEQGEDEQPRVPPKTETERMLAAVWTDLFELPEVGRDDDFFGLGGDSLLAAVVAAHVYAKAGVELHLGMFADHPTLAALATAIDRCREGAGTAQQPPIVHVSRVAPIPVSLAQQAAWQASQSQRGIRSYIAARRWRVTGPLDRDALRESMSFLVRRHEILRTTFPSLAGEGAQVVHDPSPVELPCVDLRSASDIDREADRTLREQADVPMSLSRLPLQRFSLVRVGEDEHVMQRVVHHIMTDAWSGRIYFHELAQLYAARRRGEPPPLSETQDIQFADYAAWERRVLRRDGPVYQEMVRWWERRLSNRAPRLRLPFQRPGSRILRRLTSRVSARRAPEEGSVRWGIEPDVSRRLERIGQAEKATFFVVRLAAFVAQLAFETGQRDVLLGTYVANRNRLVLQSVHGFFVNHLALRFEFQPDKSFREWLRIVRRGVMEHEQRSAIPFELLCEDLKHRGVRRPPIKVIFRTSQTERQINFADLNLSLIEQRLGAMPWGFTVDHDEFAEHNGCRALFDANMYDPVGVRAWVERYKCLLSLVSQHPERSIGDLLARSQTAH